MACTCGCTLHIHSHTFPLATTALPKARRIVDVSTCVNNIMDLWHSLKAECADYLLFRCHIKVLQHDSATDS
eukprot:m.186844 g.186844  ORF g.186844 m.186844 type:complete len:72 (-) comp18492_c0_seq1:94-309(-)